MARRRGRQPPYKNINNPTDFTGGPLPSAESDEEPPVFIAQGATPEAAAYAAGAQARRARKASAPKAFMPVGGAAMPHIPHLGTEHTEGMTMAQNAEQQRYERLMAGQGAMNAGVPEQQHTSVVEMPTPQQVNPQLRGKPAGLGIAPGDVLPEAAKEDPNFRHGSGAMIAASQPELAIKYGVLRNGKWIPGQKLHNPSGGGQRTQLSQKSVEDLQKIAELQKQQTTTEGVGLPETREEAMKGMPEAAKAAASAAGEGEPLSDEERADLKKRLQGMDEFQLATIRERMMKDIIQNDEQKKIIESRLEDLTIDDLLLHNRIKQRVPVIPGKFEPTFQSVNAEEDLALKRLIMDESESVQVSQQYMIDKYSLMAVALGLFAVNGKPMGEHTDQNGNFDDDKFLKKFNRISKLPTHMIASLGVNYAWFEERVRALFVAEDVGNG